MNQPLLVLQDLYKNYGALQVTNNVSLDVFPGEIHALIGPNGAGKTTLVGQIAGLVSSDQGKVFLNQQDVSALGAPERAQLGLGRSFQITSVFSSMSAVENVALAIRVKTKKNRFFWQSAAADQAILERALSLLEAVGLKQVATENAQQLAHGELRQLELAMVLALSPSLLILDEPMAGLGAVESQQMVRLLQALKAQYGMLLIEHDMEAVFTLADRISVLVAGSIVFTGTAAEVRNSELVRQAYLGDDDA